MHAPEESQRPVAAARPRRGSSSYAARRDDFRLDVSVALAGGWAEVNDDARELGEPLGTFGTLGADFSLALGGL